ncbi:MAG: Ig-like domain-containing protein, partial [Bacteroidota bacterium]
MLLIKRYLLLDKFAASHFFLLGDTLTPRTPHFSKRMYGAGIWIGCLLLLISCGQPGAPQGGPKDDEPPTVTQVSPSDSTLNVPVDTRVVRFSFSEAIRKPAFDKEIYISPLVKRPKVILSDNARRLSIQFQEELRPQTTYIVTLTDVKDLNESNALAKPYVLAFSTGDVLDSMQIKGEIEAPVIGKKEEKMLVFLYDADSIVNDSFDRVRPAYISQSDDQGKFTFKYLRKAKYRVLGVKDDDKSNTYSGLLERIAIAEDSVVSFEEDSVNITEVKLFAFQADAVMPNLRSYLWHSDSTLALTFSKNLRLDALRIWMTDTLSADSQSIDFFSWLPGEKPRLFIHTSRPKNLPSLIHISGLADSLGQKLDTVLRVDNFRYKALKEPTLVKPSLSLDSLGWEVFLPLRLPVGVHPLITLTDTAQAPRTDTLPYRFDPQGFQTYIQPIPLPDTALPYILKLNGALADTSLSDSTFAYSLRWFAKEDLGTLSGSVRLDSPFVGPVLVEFFNDQKERIAFSQDTTFALKNLIPGNYTARVILDADSNGVWTPGDIQTRRKPERIFEDPTPIQIRANWDFEDQIIQVRMVADKIPVDSTAVTSPEGEE